LALVLSAAELAFADVHPEVSYQVEDIIFPEPLIVPDGESRTVQLILTPTEPEAGQPFYELRLISFVSASEPLATHALGQLTIGTSLASEAIALDQVRARCTEPVDIANFYEKVAQQQIALGPSFRWLTAGWRGQGEALGRLQQPVGLGDLSDSVLHPGLLDACFQMTGLTNPTAPETRLPFAVGRLQLYQPITGQAWWCHAQQIAEAKWDIRLFDDLGQLVVAIDGFELRTAAPTAIQGTEPWRDWLYTMQWQPRPSFGLPLDNLPTLAAIDEQLRAKLPQWQADSTKLAAYRAGLARLEALGVDYVLAALTNAGLTFTKKAIWPTEQMARQLGVVPQHQRLFARMLAMLAEAGVLTRVDDAWKVKRIPAIKDPQMQFHALQETYGDVIGAELTLLQRCGSQLGDVLRGQQDPLDLLFPGGDAQTVTHIYQKSPSARLMNQLIYDVVATQLAGLPAEQGIRILEIGAGTGGTTAGLLPLLPAGQTEYTFTDIGGSFLKKASETFADYPFMQYRPLDIEQSPVAQGFGRHQYDLIIAANVLHATRNLRETLTHIKQLLAPGGRLLLLEGTDRSNWVDLTFGLTDGWWRFADDRANHPLLTANEWQERLLTCGFAAAISAPSSTAANLNLGQTLIVAQADQATVAPERGWLIFADEQGTGQALAAQMRQRGEQPWLVYAKERYCQLDATTYQIDPASSQDYRQLLAAAPPLQGVIHLWSLDAPPLCQPSDLEVAAQQSCGSILALVQAMLEELTDPPRLWLVTQEAQAVTAQDRVNGVAQSPVWGLGRVIAQEHPELHCVRLDLATDQNFAAQANRLWTEIHSSLAGTPVAEQVALRQAKRYVAHLAPYEQAQNEYKVAPPIAIQAEATYVITGGLGGLGLLTAQWLVKHGARHLLLVGRHGATAQAQAQVAQLEQLGAEVQIACADVTDIEQVRAVLATIHAAYPLRGVIHAVGVLDDGILLQQNWERFVKVLAPKMWGAWHLHTLTQEMPLDFFVLYSSIAGLLGNQGQANHAAANVFLDTLAAYRQAQGLPALSIAWGPWAEIGAAAHLQASMAAQGMQMIDPQRGIQIFAHLLNQPQAHMGVLPINRSLRATAPKAGRLTAAPAIPEKNLRQELAALLPDVRFARIANHVETQLAYVLGWSASKRIDPKAIISELGLDSLMAVELRNRLQEALAVKLSPVLVFEYPTLEKLSQHLC
ncbi:MAG: SDR family NAD(P)-dependent oxidoreductase, partial [Chloroflexi bacterium]|nr:SDR family NAD(P)-dependent oxidoreductase [Chloroflexota bacterium]